MTSETAAPQRRTQAARREESGQRLVKAAITVASQRGVSATTFQAISEESGLSRSLVTQRFGSKQGLINAVIAHVHASFERPLEHGKITELAGLPALMFYIDAFLTELTENPDKRTYFMLLADAVAEISDLRAQFAAEHDLVRGMIEDILRRGIRDGTIAPDSDTHAAALMIGSLQLGIAIQMLVDPNMDIEPIRATCKQMLRRSFAA